MCKKNLALFAGYKYRGEKYNTNYTIEYTVFLFSDLFEGLLSKIRGGLGPL
jgi:hypothetical protein